MELTISIISATFNSVNDLKCSIVSLRNQTDHNFEWIIIDGCSSDGTVELIKANSDLVSKFISEPDFGIYDAINKALRMVKTDYYLILGADDRLHTHAVESYRHVANTTHADLITAKIIRNGRVESWKPRWPWLYAHHAYVSEHAVGTLIRRSLHERFGFYSNQYPIGADLVFLKQVCASPDTTLHRSNFVAGEFGHSGISRVDRAGAICDYFRGQLETEKNKSLQVFLFIAKLLWNAVSLAQHTKRVN